ncbi:MAG: hypothetical protein SAJ37_18170 [Oscillatoria sp. PMC 1068.18]|nr:hypothetical protein [Oscillatoria sp. PMC 1076.18]MEC4990662.1 hypothetical protein [Oscillatoria sp. PMC 1068.18]
MQFTKKVKTMVAVVASAILLTPTAVLANRYEDQIQGQLIRAAIALGFNNYRLTHNAFIDDLGDNGEDSLTVTLRSGVSYHIIGVCDQDCSDLDLRLYDDRGNLIDSDDEGDDLPVVSVTPRWTGQFKVEVDMYNCDANYCYYGVGAFGR